MDQIRERISLNYQVLPRSQRKLAEYLFHHLDHAILLTSSQLAKEANVSQSTVVRLIHALGFHGYAEFKRTVGKKVLEDYSTPARLARSAEVFQSRGSLLMDILRGDMENIGAIGSNNQESAFDTAVRKLCSADTLYILGLRSSFALAFYLAFDLRFFLSSVRLLQLGVGDIPEQVRGVGPKDVLVVISFRRYTREAVRIAEKVKEKGAYILAVTNSRISPIAQLADLALIAETRIPAYFESYTAPMSLLNALITAIAYREKEKALPELNALEKEFKTFETFVR